MTRAQAAASGLAYLALGHIHTQGQMEAGSTLCAWPGCPMGRGFDETGVKGVYICQISPQGAQATFRPLGGGRYEDLTLPAGPDPLASILAQLPPDTGRDVYRLTLTGESEPVDLDRLQNALSGRFFHLQPGTGRSLPGTCGRGRARIAWRGGIFRFCSRPLKTPPGREAEALCLAARISRRILEGQEVTLP